MRRTYPPPSTFLKTYSAAISTNFSNYVFDTQDPVTPCMIRRLWYMVNTTAGQGNPLRVRLARLPRNWVIDGDGRPRVGTVLAEYRVQQGQPFEARVDLDVPEEGWLIGTIVTQPAVIATIQSARWTLLPYVEGKRPDLRRSSTLRNRETIRFPDVALTGNLVTMRSSRLIGSPYIITRILYSGSITNQVVSMIRPFVGWDVDTSVPAGLTARTGRVPGEDIISPTRFGTFDPAAARLNPHTKIQEVRPWKNVRFTPSAIKMIYQTTTTTTTFRVAVEIEYLPVKPWWREPALRELARGF